ncbi:HAD family hydrolase [Corynebacterium renale]|uniref:HAD family hydrolase n=1 Tax=Corynebacterium renale TaxID=1724 RepID=UPI000DA32AFB|nr:HAD family hydrolase [Corynebacterium renale]SQG64323.1 HAD family hydrolase [Corynebacterium renale]STC94929.1 HAD family hydrolase [Corynebacterium renale]
MEQFSLVAVDMDGTFLDGNGEIPPGFADTLAALSERGIAFTPASGRQLATLRNIFAPYDGNFDFIAENGTVVAAGDQLIDITPLDTAAVAAIVDLCEREPERFAVVVCMPETSYMDSTNPVARREIEIYYHALELLDDLRELDYSRVVKLAVFCFTPGSETDYQAIKEAAAGQQCVASSPYWVDVMDPTANKARALETLARHHGFSVENTIAFGDYLNDLELLQAAGRSYAMDNAHPEVKKIADEIVPPNTEYGVIQTLDRLLGR